MNQNRTHSILQRLPAILAVTAASYGLQEKSDRPASAKGADKQTHGATERTSTSQVH